MRIARSIRIEINFALDWPCCRRGI